MQLLYEFFHYRILDVSTVKILSKGWNLAEIPPKKSMHRAIDDILESIEELKFYKNNIFKS